MKTPGFVAGLLVAAFTAFAAPELEAQTSPQSQQPTVPTAVMNGDESEYVNNLYLAYIQSPSRVVDNEAFTGLTALSTALIERTSVEPAGVVGIDAERDDLSIFPFIYWPVTPQSRPLSDEAQRKVQHYIDTGGIIVVDVQSNSSTDYRRVFGNVNTRGLVSLDNDHTLTRSFYLVSQLQGTTSTGTVLVEAVGENDSKEVSAIIVGNMGWANAWSAKSLEAESEAQEMAIRSGINMVMYALTGDYKSDVNQVNAILERLGR